MKLRCLDGEVRDAVLTTDSAASSYGQPVLVVDGQPVDQFSAAFLQVVDATGDEVEALQAAGYYLGGYRLADRGNTRPRT